MGRGQKGNRGGRGGGGRDRQQGSEDEDDHRPIAKQNANVGMLPPSSSEDESSEEEGGQNPNAGMMPPSSSEDEAEEDTRPKAMGKGKALDYGGSKKEESEESDEGPDPETMRKEMEQLALVKKRREEQACGQEGREGGVGPLQAHVRLQPPSRNADMGRCGEMWGDMGRHSAAERQPRDSRETAERQPRGSRGAAERQPRGSRGAAEGQPRGSRGAAEGQPRGSRGAAEGQPRGSREVALSSRPGPGPVHIAGMREPEGGWAAATSSV
ncbi:hypothetical protein EMIHUDRAFT_438929 [Emiliania huxleyi CCMP1516]|uniref:Hyaluronan/mRNA-binding protein domain-containing protein n=2 Tax=Emiliania huxleyi TaxID=2903 RepID=A0A0D3I3I2_EMIH1|nr:hypothetical protein EMIHUDRAFT_438929 [Emiliania huxleyi CCMP1516]EOD05817.1 hypothetical protein EMIHUDRAFT_438929 [Emiliania huxleyi CCMP1516]|eukprot:XP_005758246.1 hypothetical protein EMIHUDRAFT_438929 [Emiliania huxleyi CCMP1516]